MWGGKSIICDTFTPLKIRVEIAVDPTSAFGTIFCHTPKRSFPLSQCSFIAMEEGPIVLYQGTLYLSSSSIEWTILKRGWENELFELTLKEVEKLQFLLEEECTVSGQSKVALTPVLQLTDPLGTSANLNAPEFEKALLQSHYSKKIIGLSHYYCPPHMVKKSLQLLKDKGFTILDALNRTVHLFSEKNFSWSLEKEVVRLEGSIDFEGKALPVEKVLQARGRFLVLSPTAVALLPDKEELGLAGVPFELCAGGVTYPRTEVSLMYQEMRDYCTPLQEVEEIDPAPLFKGTLRPYQKVGLSWIHSLWSQGFSGLLADDMGLGKTVQILAFLSHLPQERHLVIVPKSLLGNWEREIDRFLPGSTIVLRTYHSIREHPPEEEFGTIILDEAQTIKNSATQIAQAVRTLKGRFRIALSGTPIENSVEDLISQFEFLLPGMAFPSERKALFKKLRPFLLRRTKQDVLKDLPERDDQLIYVDMTEEQKAFYDSFLTREKLKIKENGESHKMEIFEVILRLRQIACHPLLLSDEITSSGKLDRVLEDLNLCMQEGSKVAVFSQFTSLLTLLKRQLSHPYLYLDGETKERQHVVDQFQSGACPLLLSSLKVGGVGLNLTEADYVFILDPWWNEAVEEQAISRAHRLGRTGKVISRRYISKGTIEEQMLLLKHSKQELSESLFDKRL